MSTIEKKFGVYAVTLDTDMGDGATGCWIEVRAKGKIFSASLALLLDMGELEIDGDGVEVPQATIEEIETWALANGY